MGAPVRRGNSAKWERRMRESGNEIWAKVRVIGARKREWKGILPAAPAMLRGPRMISELTRSHSTSTGSRLGGRPAILRWLWWAPLLIAAVYLLTLAVQFNRLLASTYLSADAASAPVIGELFGRASGHPQ